MQARWIRFSALGKAATMTAMISVFFLGLSCASGSGEGSGGAAPPRTTAQGVQPPKGSKLAQIEAGMDEERVRGIMGAPDNRNSYMTGKQWIPFYFGPVAREDWSYKGTGRVVFNRNRWNGSLAVAHTLYDPNEDAR